eukprot:9416-Heterococcus_DN1.PRE.4
MKEAATELLGDRRAAANGMLESCPTGARQPCAIRHLLLDRQCDQHLCQLFPECTLDASQEDVCTNATYSNISLSDNASTDTDSSISTCSTLSRASTCVYEAVQMCHVVELHTVASSTFDMQLASVYALQWTRITSLINTAARSNRYHHLQCNAGLVYGYESLTSCALHYTGRLLLTPSCELYHTPPPLRIMLNKAKSRWPQCTQLNQIF